VATLSTVRNAEIARHRWRAYAVLAVSVLEMTL